MKRITRWFVLVSLFVLIGCQQQPSEKVVRYLENYEIIGEERDEIIGEVSDTIYESIDRSNSDAEEYFFEYIDREVEVTPPEGRYQISGGMSGTVYVYDEDGVLLLNEIIDFSSVGGVTVNLNGKHTVRLDGVESASILPVETNPSIELTTGIWEVGIDIEPGNYSIYAPYYGFGDLHVYEEGEPPRLFEFIDSLPEKSVELELKEGQILRVSGLGLIYFEQP